jgi:hypothetical protein
VRGISSTVEARFDASFEQAARNTKHNALALN